MNFSSANTISYKVVLSDILQNVNDNSHKLFTKGYYTSMIQQALEQLSFTTYAFTRIIDIATPTTLTYQIPTGCFNLREAKVYNGTCCAKGDGQKIWWKRNFRLVNGTYINTESQLDPFIEGYTTDSNIYWYGIEGNTVYFSPSCASYGRIELIFNSSITVYGDTPIIPIQLRKVVTDMVTLECFKKLKVKNPKLYIPLYRDAYVDLYDRTNGSMPQAKMWCSNLDTASRDSLNEYLSRPNV